MRAHQHLAGNTSRGFSTVIRVFVVFFVTLIASFGSLKAADAETRTLKLYHVHTGEREEITFKRNGVYLPDGLNRINRILRDWRRNEPIKMDPRLLDTVWEVYQKTGSHEFINVVCGYRSPATNSMLRRRSNGVAEKSQHMKGKAMDFYIPGVPLKKLRYLGLQRQAGGVGYYPTSGSPFVHLDVGSVRHWPRMSRSELMAVFPNGNTLHVPSDGRPLAGYSVALASYKSRQRSGSSLKYDTSGGSDSGSKPHISLLAALFGGGADEAEDNNSGEDTAVASTKPVKQSKQAEVLMAAAPVEKRGNPKPSKEILVAALPQRSTPAPLAIVRPSQDLNAVEQPVGTEALAFAVPVPAHKPRMNPVLAEPTADAALAARMAPADSATVQLASTDPKAEAAAIRASVGGEPPVADVAAVEEAPFLAGAVPVPSHKPAREQDSFMVASVAVPEPRPMIKSNAAPMVASLAPDTVADQSVDVAMATPEPKPNSTDIKLRKLLAEQNSIDPETVADTGAKTTDKAAKPRAGDAKRARKPVVVPVTQDLGKFALTKEPVTNNGNEVVAVNYGQESVWNAPTEVYVAGFSTDAPQDMNKFTGKAVNFLKVAKFKKAK